jgi:hypothetical protein
VITRTPADDRRHELKFTAAEWHFHRLHAWLRMRPEGFRRAYPNRRVNNVYFDRGDFEFFRDSVEGSTARVKVRYRWYGKSRLPGPGRLEMKQRRNQLGWKKVFDIGSLDPELRRWPDIRARIIQQQPLEGRRWLQACDIYLIVNSYLREYWVSADGRLRVTFDRHQMVFDQRYGAPVNVTRAAPIDPMLVMEVKCPPHAVLAASRLVGDLPLTLCRNSKYCSAIDAITGT